MGKIADKLEGINRTLEKILATMEKPKNKVVRALEIFTLGVSALGLIYVVDLIKRWVLGE
jgi:hypothetical protein